MTIKCFKLKSQRFEHTAGTICYEYTGYTYGLVRDDDNYSRVQHTAVTFSPKGETPFFTVPINELEDVI